MKTRILFVLTLVILSFISGMSQHPHSDVLIISTIHRAHDLNPNYTYDSLFQFIEKFDPDIIGIEIRREDIDSPETYLKANYPFEMYECITRFPSKQVFGIDWLGDDLEGRTIPENYWKEKSKIKSLQRKLSADSTMQKRLSVLDIISKEKTRLVLNSTLLELNDGRYDLLNHIYYEQLTLLLKDTEYSLLTDFYKKRDEKIAQNILDIIKNNPGKKMIFLVGADHRDHALKSVSQELAH